MKILTVIGARPQFVKAATVARQVAQRDEVQEVIVHTGQHFDANMSDVFFSELQIPKPDYHLGIGGGGHGAMTGRMLEAIEGVLLSEQPDCLLIYGDTNSTLAGALAAVKLHIPVAHVEAGLRSFNRRMPEEINRIAADHVSEILFTPTATATENLKQEGLGADLVCQVGDVMYDAALFYKDRARKPDWFDAITGEGEYILSTLHRAENVDVPDKLHSILRGLDQIGKTVILPLHPRTRQAIERNSIKLSDNVKIVDPVGYLEMVYLINNAGLIMTDSGGLQKEALFFDKMCITMREETEWVETVQSGANVLVGSDLEKISEYGRSSFGQTPPDLDLYGKGDASEKIVNELQSRIEKIQ